ncbi:MAG TPA: SufD family Fe-S cluster assembly protein, partial [Vicinamibacterales bacterium]|nr:SufD family Fe-S cluster assembly protein [Vicinamibacterales bacterium]
MTAAVESIRERAAETFAKLGWPTPRIEEWKYTNLAPLAKTKWRFDEGTSEVETPLTFGARAYAELVFVNGRLVRQSGERLAAPREERHYADWERNAMVALNTANMQDGARIEIPAGKVVEGFIHLLFIGHGDGIWSHPRNLVIVGANAQVAIAETYIGNGAYFTNAVTEIVAGEGAVVDHYRVECESLSAYHVGNVYIHEERGANVTSRSIAIGGALTRSETHVILGGEGAAITLDGLFVGTGKQHLDNRTVIDHVKPHCESLELYKGILDQSARGVFDGRIIVRPDA